jgi:hypothetical protein
MTYPPPPPDQSGQGGFQYDPYGSQPGSQPPNPGGYSPQPQQPGYGQPSQPPAPGGYGQPSQPQQPGYSGAPQLPPAAPGYPPPYGAPMGMQLPKGMAVASMVLGIIGVVFLCFAYTVIGGFLGIICGIIAAIMGGVGLKRVKEGTGGGKGMAITGLVLGIIASAFALIVVIAVLSGLAMIGGSASMM